MTHRLRMRTALLLLAIASPASATLGLLATIDLESALPRMHPTTDWILPVASQADDPAPALASFDELIDSIPADQSSTLQIFRWVQSPQVYVFIYPNLETQARALNRVAAFVEKAGAPRDRVLTDAELSATIEATGKSEETYFVGHDYTAGALADFFNTAQHSGVSLNPQERDLQSRLLQFGFFSASAQQTLTASQPERVLLSLAPENAPGLSAQDRRLKFASVLRHELSHAEFFINPAYQAYCLRSWQDLSELHRQIFTEELAALGYDTTNLILMANEFQAFLWEPLRGAFIDARLQKQGSSLAKLRADFMEKLLSINPPITVMFAIPGFDTPIVWWEQTHLVKTSKPIQ